MFGDIEDFVVSEWRFADLLDHWEERWAIIRNNLFQCIFPVVIMFLVSFQGSISNAFPEVNMGC